MQVKLFAPESYWLASAEAKRETCNGCGTKGLGGWIVPDTLYGLSIERCCDIHDWMYAEGETIGDKDSADRAFLNNCLRVIDGASGFIATILRPFRRWRAMSYYTAVKDLGGPAYWNGKNKPGEMVPHGMF